MAQSSFYDLLAYLASTFRLSEEQKLLIISQQNQIRELLKSLDNQHYDSTKSNLVAKDIAIILADKLNIKQNDLELLINKILKNSFTDLFI